MGCAGLRSTGRDCAPAVAPRDRTRYFRPAALPGVEALHASFVTHRYTAHLHESWTVAAVDEGTATFELRGSHHVAPAGTTFLIPPGAVHTGEPATPGGYRYRVLYLEPERCLDESAVSLSTRPTSHAPVVVRHPELAGRLTRLHATLESPGVALEQSELLSSAIVALSDLLSEKQRRTPTSHRSVSEAIDYIHVHFVEDFSLHDLAGAVGMSPHHLVRRFHEEVGMPPSRYRRRLRVLAAQRLLRSGCQPADAADEAGFYDQSHLNRHFKLVTGVTPRQYALAR